MPAVRTVSAGTGTGRWGWRRTTGLTAAGVIGSAALVSAAAAGLVAQSRAARRAIGPRRSVAPYHDGRYGEGDGTSLRLAVLGDSGGAGLGAEGPADTIGALLAQWTAHAAQRRVILTNTAVVGARSADLAVQVQRVAWVRPHVAVIIIGANDVTHAIPHRRAATDLGLAVAELRVLGSEVVVGTCPDLGVIAALPQPLRWVGGRSSAALARQQGVATLAAGGRAVPLGTLAGPAFIADPVGMFATDGFHPSSAGYATLAGALLPEVLDALRLSGRSDRLPVRHPGPYRRVRDRRRSMRRLLARAR